MVKNKKSKIDVAKVAKLPKGEFHFQDARDKKKSVEVKPQKIGLEKVLNCSVTEYCNSVCNGLEQYDLAGVHYYSFRGYDLMENFLGEVPKNAEVVVEKQIENSGDGYCYVSGIALIPKK